MSKPELTSGISELLLYIVLINSLFIIILLITNIVVISKFKRLSYKYNKFMENSSGESIERQIEKCFLKSEELFNKNREIEHHLNEIDRTLMNCIQKVSLVRFNAFDETGSDLSYSLALLDSNNNGVVLTSLFLRDGSTTYGKPIVGGKSRYPLSAEEIKAIDNAIKRHREAYYA
ncbi:MAG: DUF4446 family protein [Clostridiaceae bacterium]|nr:DUF4446 family protein [Clostridiaceae bacterium]